MVPAALLLSLVACNPPPAQGGIAGLTVQDENGKNYVVVTDAKGEIQTDDAGNILEIETQPDGKAATNTAGAPVTNYIAPPKQIVYADYYETAHFKFRVPEGWEKKDAGKMSMQLKGHEAVWEMQLLRRQTLEDTANLSRQLLLTLAQEAGKKPLEEAEKVILGYPGILLRQPLTADGTDSVYDAYLFAHGEDVLAIYLKYPLGEQELLDFDSLIKQMTVKPLGNESEITSAP